MKHSFYLFLLGFGLLATSAMAQMPKAINYQAVARNTSGQALANQTIKVRLSILNTAAGNAILYSETRQVTTNALGLFNVQIGAQGAVSTSGNFAAISWTNNVASVESLKVELDINNNDSFVDMGTQGLVSVPYAFSADEAINTVNIGGHYVNTTTPANGDVLKWGGSSWAPQPVSKVVSIDSPGISVASSSQIFAFSHTPVEVTVTVGQTLTVSISAILGASSGAATSVGLNPCYQKGDDQVIPFYPTSYLNVASISNRNIYTLSGTLRVVPEGGPVLGGTIPPGTYKIGLGVRNTGAMPLNSNDSVNGFILIQ